MEVALAEVEMVMALAAVEMEMVSAEEEMEMVLEEVEMEMAEVEMEMAVVDMEMGVDVMAMGAVGVTILVPTVPHEAHPDLTMHWEACWQRCVEWGPHLVPSWRLEMCTSQACRPSQDASHPKEGTQCAMHICWDCAVGGIGVRSIILMVTCRMNSWRGWWQ